MITLIHAYHKLSCNNNINNDDDDNDDHNKSNYMNKSNDIIIRALQFYCHYFLNTLINQLIS